MTSRPVMALPFGLLRISLISIILFFLVVCALRRLCRFARLCAFGELCRFARSPLRSSHHPRFACITSPLRRHHRTASATTSPQATSLSKAIMIVYADEGAAECQYLSKRYQQRVVYLARRRGTKACDEQCTPEGAHCHCDDQLQAFHHALLISSAQRCHTYLRRVSYSFWFLKLSWSCGCLVGSFMRCATADATCPQ